MPGSRIARVRSRGGLLAAAAVVATTAVAGVAGAAEQQADATVAADNGLEFKPNAVTIEVGDTVTWTFDNPDQFHNVAAGPQSPTPWTFRSGDASRDHPDASYTFDAAGRYEFVCEVHADMRGTVTVGDGGGAPPNDPPADPPSETPTDTPPQQPVQQGSGGGSVDDHTKTPAPDGVQDAVKPQIDRVRARAKRRAVRVRFALSEAATVEIRVERRSGRVYRTKRVHSPAGRHGVKVRGKRIRRGRYMVELLARDAAGNRSAPATKSVRGRR